MKYKRSWRTETLALHGGQEPDPTTGSRAVPIYQTTSYQFRDTDHAANLFALKEFGNIYTRLMNPTTDVFEKRMALLDGGIGALAVASGQSAITLALLNIAQAGDEIVSMDNLYGGTYNLFHHTFARLGIKVNFVPSNDLAALERAITYKTKAVYAESVGNPKLDVADLEGISAVAHRNGIPFVLDNTVTPYTLRPLDHRGGHRRLFGDEIHRRPRNLAGRRDRRFGEIRLDQRQVSPHRRSRSELPRRGLCGVPGAPGQHRLYHQGPGDPPAGSGPGAFAL